MKKAVIMIITLSAFVFNINIINAKEDLMGTHRESILEVDKRDEADMDIVIETPLEFINSIEKNQQLSQAEKDRMILGVRRDMMSRATSYLYMTAIVSVSVTDSYSCHPYFYIKCWNSGGRPGPMQEVLNANIDLNDDGTVKQFSGKLYYHLKSGSELYWDLNGSFYNNGTTTVGGGIKIPIGEEASINFSVSYSTNFYGYAHKSGTFRH